MKPLAKVRSVFTALQFTRWPEKPFQPFPLEGEAREEALRRIASYSRGFGSTLAQLEPYRGAPVASPPEPVAAPADSATAPVKR